MNNDETVPAVAGPLDVPVRRLLAVLRWPASPVGTLAPWYVIGWRLLWAPAIYAGFALTFAGIAMAQGIYSARDWWRRAA